MTMSLREAATRLVDSWDRDPQGPWPELGDLREALAEAARAKEEKAEPAPTVQRESVTDALSIVKTYGPWGPDLNDAHRRQIVLAEEVLRLRHVYELAVRGRAEMRDALRREREAENELPMSDRNGVLFDTIKNALAELSRNEALNSAMKITEKLDRLREERRRRLGLYELAETVATRIDATMQEQKP